MYLFWTPQFIFWVCVAKKRGGLSFRSKNLFPSWFKNLIHFLEQPKNIFYSNLSVEFYNFLSKINICDNSFLKRKKCLDLYYACLFENHFIRPMISIEIIDGTHYKYIFFIIPGVDNNFLLIFGNYSICFYVKIINFIILMKKIHFNSIFFHQNDDFHFHLSTNFLNCSGMVGQLISCMADYR